MKVNPDIRKAQIICTELFEDYLLSDKDTMITTMIKDTRIDLKLINANISKYRRCIYDVYYNTLYLNKRKSTLEDTVTAILVGVFKYTIRKDNYLEQLENINYSYNFDYKYKLLYESLLDLGLIKEIPCKFCNPKIKKIITSYEEFSVMILNQEQNNEILNDICNEIAINLICKYK